MSEMHAQLLDLVTSELRRNVMFLLNVYRCVLKREADPEQTSGEKILHKSPRSRLDPAPKQHICVEEEGETSHQKLVDDHQS